VLDSLQEKYLLSETLRTIIAQLKATSSENVDIAQPAAHLQEIRNKFKSAGMETLRILRGYQQVLQTALKQKDYSKVGAIYQPNSARCGELKAMLEKRARVDSIQGSALQKLKDRLRLRDPDDSSRSIFQYTNIDKIEIQFEKGFIETVKVWVTINSSQFIFENIFAVGFSSVSNYKNLARTRLFIRNGKGELHNYFIYASDVFRNYDNRLNNYTRDYSPADTSFAINPAEYPEITLRKEKYVNLIDAKLYGDLAGIDKTKPNGLFQIEVSKRFNINTSRIQAGSHRCDFGYFNYIDLFGSLSKIEQNNRELVLQNAGITSNGSIISPNYATNLDFLRYENYTAGVNVGILLFDMPDDKFTTYLDFGVKYGHCIIADTVFMLSTNSFTKSFNKRVEAHTLTFQFPKLSIELFPESRITPKIAWQLNSTRLFSNNQFKQVISYEKSDVTDYLREKNSRLSNEYEIYVKIAPNKDDRTSHIFLRWRLFTQVGDANTSFSQFQVGYAYNWTLNK
jgi:hypothetical protein